MDQHQPGDVSESKSSDEMAAARCVALKNASALTTSCQELQEAQIAWITCKYCVHHAIAARGVGFLIGIRQPRSFMVLFTPRTPQ